MGGQLIIVLLMLVVSFILPLLILMNALPKIMLDVLKKISVPILLIIVVFLLVFSFYAVDLWTEGIIDIDKKGQIGDKIGGIMNPIIAIAGVIVTGLAFWMQYQANEVVRAQFKNQQFDNHVYKLADITRENIARWKKIDKKTGDTFNDRLVAVSVLESYDILLTEMKIFYRQWSLNQQKKIADDKYLESLKELYSSYFNKPMNDEEFYANWLLSEVSYLIIFFGLEDRGRENIQTYIGKYYNTEFLNAVINFFSYKATIMEKVPGEQHGSYKERMKIVFKFRLRQPYETDKIVDTVQYNGTPSSFKSTWIFNNCNEPLLDSEFPYKYYNGTETLFSHYYRHLLNTYKYIDTFPNLAYDVRWQVYAKLIRTQFTNTEQILFFINSISIIGREWEYNHSTSRINPIKATINKRLVTKYDIIKNIPLGDRIKYNIQAFYPDIEWEDTPIDFENQSIDYEHSIRVAFERDFYQ